jgi:hypothetical protein
MQRLNPEGVGAHVPPLAQVPESGLPEQSRPWAVKVTGVVSTEASGVHEPPLYPGGSTCIIGLFGGVYPPSGTGEQPPSFAGFSYGVIPHPPPMAAFR